MSITADSQPLRQAEIDDLFENLEYCGRGARFTRRIIFRGAGAITMAIVSAMNATTYRGTIRAPTVVCLECGHLTHLPGGLARAEQRME